MKKAIYKITITNWKKYNANRKKSYRSVMISERFLDDAKIQSLTPVSRLLFLSCILASSQSDQGQCEVNHESLQRQSGVKSQSIQSQLDLLQSLRLLSYESISPLMNRNEMKGNEKKRITLKGKQVEKSDNQPDKKPDASQPPKTAAPVEEKVNVVIALYCDLWRSRYKTDKSPTIMPDHAKKMNQFVKTAGVEKAKVFVEAYLQMVDSWFVTKRHDIPTLVGSLNAITHFIDTGQMITRRQTNQLDLASTNQSTLDALRNGEI